MTQRRYVIIVGAMKSGTTTLFDVLARHPAIAPATAPGWTRAGLEVALPVHLAELPGVVRRGCGARLWRVRRERSQQECQADRDRVPHGSWDAGPARTFPGLSA